MKTLFLTGASGGIGQEIRKDLEKIGWKVIAPTDQQLDLTTDFDVKQEVDAFVHCAGINTLCHHSRLDIVEMQRVFEIDTFSFVKLCSQLTIRPGGSVVAIGSIYATETKENRLYYTMAKHALYGSVKTLALEMSTENIKVNMISPGFVDTPLTRQNLTQERIDYLDENIPLGMVSAWEIADFVVYLLENNRSITGQNIIIDGGYTLKGI